MNDLDQIAATLAKPSPSPEIVAAGRARLQNAASRGSRPRTFLWTSGAIGLGAAAAAVLVLMTSIGATKAADPAAQPMLLVAAANAERQATTGKYWRLRFEQHPTWWTKHQKKATFDQWANARGFWFKVDTGRVGKSVDDRRFGFCGKAVPFGFFANLPTDPDALRAAAVKATDQIKLPTPQPLHSSASSCLAGLLANSPAPPKVRAAAYRVIEALAETKTVGPKTDSKGRTGEGLRIGAEGSGMLMIIDLKTATVLETQYSQDNPKTPQKEGYTASHTFLINEWTDTAPA